MNHKSEELEIFLKNQIKKVIQEYDRKRARQQIDPLFIKHAERRTEKGAGPPEYGVQGSTIKFVGLRGDTIVFAINSSEYDDPTRSGYGATYSVSVQFKDYNDIINDPLLTLKEKTFKLVKESGVRFDCTCPAFRYYYRYVATSKDDSSIVNEPRRAEVTNPSNRGIMCKHTDRITEVYPFWWQQIFKALREG